MHGPQCYHGSWMSLLRNDHSLRCHNGSIAMVHGQKTTAEPTNEIDGYSDSGIGIYVSDETPIDIKY